MSEMWGRRAPEGMLDVAQREAKESKLTKQAKSTGRSPDPASLATSCGAPGPRGGGDGLAQNGGLRWAGVSSRGCGRGPLMAPLPPPASCPPCVIPRPRLEWPAWISTPAPPVIAPAPACCSLCDLNLVSWIAWAWAWAHHPTQSDKIWGQGSQCSIKAYLFLQCLIT